MKVVNLKNEKYDVYIGRGGTFDKYGTLTSSPLLNPYRIKNRTRKEVLGLYQTFFDKQINENPIIHYGLFIGTFKQYLESIKDKVLGCWCKPLDCHGNIIEKWVNGNL